MLNLELWRTRFADAMTLRQWSPRTIETYTEVLRGFFEFLDATGVDTLSGITRDTLEGFRTHLFELRRAGQPLAMRTQALHLVAVKAFTRFLWREHFLLIDPGAGLELPKTPRSLPRAILSEAEVCQLLERPDVTRFLGLRNRAMLEMLYGTAVRNSELCGVSLNDLDLSRHEVYVRDGKGRKSRVLPLGDAAQYWLELYLRQERPALVRTGRETRVFLSWRGLTIHRANLSLMVREAAVEAGLTKVVTPHILRHCCATHMLARGASLRHLQEFLGHASLATTQIYTKVEMSDLRRVLKRCHPRERGWQA